MLYLTIRLQGYEFFSEQFFRKKNRECDVSLRGMKLKMGEDQVNGYLLTRGIARNIAEQSTYPLEIFTTSPDTIYFTFERQAIKRLPAEKTTNISRIRLVDSVAHHHDSIQRRSLVTK